MNELSVNRTPELIAAEINGIKQQTRKILLYNSIEIGRRLTEAKTMLPHGEWGTWLEKSVDYKQSTANNLMKIFQEYGADQINLLGESNSQALGNLNYTQAIALLGIPTDEREEFVKENDIDNMSTRELQKAIKERNEALNKIKEIEKASDEKENEVVKLQEEKNKVEESLKKEKEKSKEKIKAIEQKLEEAKKQLVTAESAGNAEEVQKLQATVNEMQSDLDSSAQRIDELEKQLKEKAIEATATEIIEKVPEEIKKELEELRQKTKNSNATKFKVYFDTLVNNFNGLLEALEEISDITVKEKYKSAVHGLIEKMGERL